MNAQALQQIFLELLGDVAPDADLQTIEPDESLREQLDIDSMDLLRLAQAIHRRLGVDVPELHYPQLDSLDTAMAYLAPRVDA